VQATQTPWLAVRVPDAASLNARVANALVVLQAPRKDSSVLDSVCMANLGDRRQVLETVGGDR
jgi:hypothetical protein